MSKKWKGRRTVGGSALEIPPAGAGQLQPARDEDAETIADLEQRLAAMVDERLASLARRVDLLYRYTVGDRAGGRYMVPNMHQRGEEFPEAEP